MENSEKILFTDDASQWYVALGERWIGPLKASNVYEKIISGEITWAHYVWKQGQAEWRRICDVKSFQAALPKRPGKELTKELKKDLKPAIRSAVRRAVTKPLPVKTWFLHYQDSQFGPLSEEEIRQFLKSGKVQERVYAWREGMKNWELLDQIETFRAKTASRSPERRGSPRRPLIAKILMSDGQTVATGVCRDISVGGLQLLTEDIPGAVGTSLKMNISPSTNDAGTRIEPFVAEGVIVRILEDGRGFSFRFKKLSKEAQSAIESYFQSAF